MRIVDTNATAPNTPVQTGRTSSTRPADTTGSNSPAGQSASSGDNVQLSGISDKVAQTLRNDASVQAEKINQITAAVQSGTYQVNAKAVSHALVKQALSGADPDGDNDGR